MRRPPAAQLALACAALLAAAPAALAAAHMRGVRPEQAEAYAPKGGKFTCLDGSRTIDYAAVNNDFCDCSDGSDEPGTSACANGVFYCRNRGHEARVISSAFVDDGVCDCCDGSDELDGCGNTCIEKNAAVRENLKQQVLQYKAALDKRREYAKQAVSARKEMKAKLAGIDGEIAAAEADVKKREGEKEKLEATADERRAAREKKRAEEEAALEKKRAEEEAAEAAKAAEEAAKTAEGEGAAAGEGGAGGEQAEGGEAQPDEESAEERGRRIASQWTKDPEAAGDAAASGGEAKGDKGTGASKGGWLSKTFNKIKAAVGAGGDSAAAEGDEDDHWDDARRCSEDGQCEDEGEEKEEEEDDESKLTDVDEDLELDAAVEAVTAAEDKVTELKAEKERLTRQVGYDYGKDDAWLALRTHCAEAREPQYTYRMCLFDRAAQVDNNAGHETKLGTWKGFEKGYTEGVFDSGDWCHQAPARSMRVTFTCGLEESAWGASEPSTCAYASSVATPAACKEEDLAALQGKLEALVKEEEELRKEIEAEEAERRAAFKQAAAEAAAAAAAAEGLSGGAVKDEL